MKQIFSYRTTKNGKIFIYSNQKEVMVLSKEKASKLQKTLERANEDEVQMILARATGSFKFGNERLQKDTQTQKYF